MVTLLQVAEVLAAILVPVGFYVVVTQVRDVRWNRLSPAIVVMAVPLLFILTVEDIIPNIATAIFGGLFFGHIITFLDVD